MCYNVQVRGGIAQLARATGSYPVGHGFKSNSRYHGPLVKRLRHRPFTAVTGVRFSHGSPMNKKRRFTSEASLFVHSLSVQNRTPQIFACGNLLEPALSYLPSYTAQTRKKRAYLSIVQKLTNNTNSLSKRKRDAPMSASFYSSHPTELPLGGIRWDVVYFVR